MRILSFIFTLLALFFPLDNGFCITLDRQEGTVNTHQILLSDVALFRKTIGLRAQLDPLFSQSEISKKQNPTDSEIVTFLIEEKLILDQFSIKDQEVGQEINSIQVNNKISRKMLTAALKEQGYSFEDYFSLIRLGLSKRSLVDREIRTRVFISDDDIKNYFYNQIQGSGRKSFEYHLNIIIVTPENFKSSKFAYDWIEQAKKEISSGTSFEVVAKKYSDDSTASTGGDLGFLKEDDISKQIRAVVTKMKVGEVSPIIGNKDTALFLIKLANIRSGQEELLDKTKEKIKTELSAVEYQRQIKFWLERQKQNSFIRLAGQSVIKN